jgi:hypothetical protein
LDYPLVIGDVGARCLSIERARERDQDQGGDGHRDRLVAAVIELSADRPTDEVKVEEVLDLTGISTGS